VTLAVLLNIKTGDFRIKELFSKYEDTTNDFIKNGCGYVVLPKTDYETDEIKCLVNETYNGFEMVISLLSNERQNKYYYYFNFEFIDKTLFLSSIKKEIYTSNPYYINETDNSQVVFMDSSTEKVEPKINVKDFDINKYLEKLIFNCPFVYASICKSIESNLPLRVIEPWVGKKIISYKENQWDRVIDLSEKVENGIIEYNSLSKEDQELVSKITDVGANEGIETPFVFSNCDADCSYWYFDDIKYSSVENEEKKEIELKGSDDNYYSICDGSISDSCLLSSWITKNDTNEYVKFLKYWYWNDVFFYPDFYPLNIEIYNGNLKNKNLWNEYSRAKNIKLYVNDKPYIILKLDDTSASQSFTLDLIDFSKLSSLKFEILDIYPGSKYKNIAISELYLSKVYDYFNFYDHIVNSYTDVYTLSGNSILIFTLNRGDFFSENKYFIKKIVLPTQDDLNGFSLNDLKGTGDGFDLDVEYGSRYYFNKIFNFKYREQTLFLDSVKIKTFDKNKPEESEISYKKQIIPAIDVKDFDINKYLLDDPEEEHIIYSYLVSRLGKNNFSIDLIKDNFARGSVGDLGKGLGYNAYYIAMKEDNKWNILFEGQDDPSCKTVKENNIPVEIYQQCQ
jgi:hypothetical protein